VTIAPHPYRYDGAVPRFQKQMQSAFQQDHDSERLLAPAFEVYDEKGLRAVLIATSGDRDDVLNMAHWFIAMFAGARVAIGMDALHPTQITNPDTGNMWEHGELAAWVEAGNRDNLVSEALSVWQVDCNAPTITTIVAYQRTAVGLQWADSERMVEGEGSIVTVSHWLDMVRHSMVNSTDIRRDAIGAYAGPFKVESRSQRATVCAAMAVATARHDGQQVIVMPSSRAESTFFRDKVPGGLDGLDGNHSSN
jgi:hypothetical protein